MKIRINKEGKTKLMLSFALLIYSVYVYISTGSYLAFIAMFASTIGDISIMSYRNCFHKKKNIHLMYGVVAFCVAHITYILAMETYFSKLLLYVGIIAFIFLLSVLAFVSKRKSRDIVFFLYSIVIGCNLINTFFYHNLAFTGMLLFVISDLVLLIGEKKKINGIWLQVIIWATYVPAEALLLTSLLSNL